MEKSISRLHPVEYTRTNTIRISQIVFLVGLFVKQFYTQPNGRLQMGDLLMMIGCLMYVVIENRFRMTMLKENRWFLGYVLSVALINAVYFVLYQDSDFNTSTFYYIYNLIIVICVSAFLREENGALFLRGLGWVIKLSLGLQAFLYVMDLGRWSGVHDRYLGTFRDPNQFSIFIFFCLLMVYIIDKVLKNRWWMIWSFLGTMVILPAASTGTMLGIVFFWVGMYISNIRSMKKIWRFTFGFLSALFILIFLVFGLGVVELPKSVTSHFMYIRIEGKLRMLTGNGDINSLLRDRVWDRVVEQPIYFIFGSGDGYNFRFDANNYELHSSILGPAFCYGIVPFLMLEIWKLKKIGRSRYFFIYVALFSEALFVVNTRQPMYWMLFVLGVLTLKPRHEEAEAEKAWTEARTVFRLGKIKALDERMLDERLKR